MRDFTNFITAGFIKMKVLFLLSLTLSPMAWIFDIFFKWHFDNADYFNYVLGAILVDHLLGSIKHCFFADSWNGKKNMQGLLLKMVVVVTIGYLFEGLDTLLVHKSVFTDFSKMTLRIMVFLYPAGNAFRNSYIITGRKFPPLGFIQKLKKLTNFVENKSTK